MARRRSFESVAVVALLWGCAAPPDPAPAPAPTIDLARFPPGAEIAQLAVGSTDSSGPAGAPVGVFVPGDPNAPVVLQFVENGEFLAFGAASLPGYPLLWHLRDLGMSVLAIDVREDHLASDAQAAYAEALRRAGSEANLVLRGASLGTLPIAELLAAGRTPAAVVLGSPVSGDVVAQRLAELSDEAFVAMRSALRGYAGDADLVDALRAFRGRKLAYLSGADELLDAGERAALADAVQQRGGRTVLDVQVGHVEIAMRLHSLLGAEHTLYALAFPGRVLLAGDLFQRRVIDSPALAQPLADALAKSDAFEEGLVMRWIRRLPPSLPDTMPEDAMRAWLDLGDPLGRLDARELDWMADVVAQVRSASAAAASDPSRPAKPLPEALFHHIAKHELDRRSRYTIRHAWSQEPIAEVACDLVDGPQPWGAPARLNLDAVNARRQLTRLALKAAGIPDRVGFDEYATPHLEVFDAGRWRRLEP